MPISPAIAAGAAIGAAKDAGSDTLGQARAGILAAETASRSNARASADQDAKAATSGPQQQAPGPHPAGGPQPTSSSTEPPLVKLARWLRLR